MHAASADLLGEALTANSVQHLRAAVEEGQKRFGIEEKKPQQVIEQLALAQARGADSRSQLQLQAQMQSISLQQLSLPSVRSGLRCWGKFAELVLGYPKEKTLPPRSEADMRLYVAIFSHGPTAANYVSYLRWACRHLGLSMAWDTDAVQAQIKGARKMNTVMIASKLQEKFALTEESVMDVVRRLDVWEQPRNGTQMWLTWQLLLRPISEVCPMQWGEPQDVAKMPKGLHSSVCVVGDKDAEDKQQLVIFLVRRKHRPQGSFWRLGCTCATNTRQFCLVHRFVDMEGFEVANGKDQHRLRSQIFALNGASMKALLNRTRRACGYQQPAVLKGFRAGKATQMLGAGFSVPSILKAGEWRSATALVYMDEESVGVKALLNDMEQELQEDDEGGSIRMQLSPEAMAG